MFVVVAVVFGDRQSGNLLHLSAKKFFFLYSFRVNIELFTVKKKEKKQRKIDRAQRNPFISRLIINNDCCIFIYFRVLHFEKSAFASIDNTHTLKHSSTQFIQFIKRFVFKYMYCE